jgi:hypothetical protein
MTTCGDLGGTDRWAQGLFRDGGQHCSGLVDLIVRVGGYLGGAHGLALVHKGFVVFVTKDSAQMGCVVRSSGTDATAKGVDANRRAEASELSLPRVYQLPNTPPATTNAPAPSPCPECNFAARQAPQQRRLFEDPIDSY